MAIRKNKKRIDPRYFLNETAYRDLNEEATTISVSDLTALNYNKLKDQAGEYTLQLGGTGALKNINVMSQVK